MATRKSSPSKKSSSAKSWGSKSAAKKSNTKKSVAKKSSSKKSASKPRGAVKKSPAKRESGKRELINTGTDKRYVRRSGSGQFTESVDVGRSLSADSRRKSSKKVKSGYGDRGDR